jgi:hypothetical protein
MKRFIEGTDRGQSTLFPEYLEDWIDEDSLPDEDAAAGGHRNGAARPGLQHDARHEHHGRPTTPGSDESVAAKHASAAAAAPP